MKWPRPFPIEGMPQSWLLWKANILVYVKAQSKQGILLQNYVSTTLIRKKTQPWRPVPAHLPFFNLRATLVRHREEMLLSSICSSKYTLIFTILSPQYDAIKTLLHIYSYLSFWIDARRIRLWFIGVASLHFIYKNRDRHSLVINSYSTHSSPVAWS